MGLPKLGVCRPAGLQNRSERLERAVEASISETESGWHLDEDAWLTRAVSAFMLVAVELPTIPSLAGEEGESS